MRAAVYIRVSTDDQVKHGYSLAEQREACCSRARILGAQEVTVFSDEGISGSTLERPGLNEMREAAREGRFQLLVVRDPDRLSRKLAHQLLITDELEKCGIKLEFLDFDWKDTPEGRLFYSIRGAIAEYEREKIRDRMGRGKEQKARQGGIPINFDVFGYQYDLETGKVSHLEHEKKVVVDIFNWFTSEDIGANGIAKRLNENGIPTRRRAGRWHRQVVKQILANTVYVGLWRFKGMYIKVPPIIDENTFYRAQEKLKEVRRLYAGKQKHGYLLSGLITCADCGNTMTGAYARWWGKRERRYTCNKTCQGYKNEGCRPVKYILADALEEAVWNQIQTWLMDPDRLAREAMGQIVGQNDPREQIMVINKHLASIEKGQEALIDVIAKGYLDHMDSIEKKLAELKRRKEKLEKRKEELLLAYRQREELSAKIDEIREISESILRRLNDLAFTEKRSLVRALVKQVIVSGRGVPGGNGLRFINVTVLAKIPEQKISS
ncbi:site-specific DNA recombinase [Desulforamulus putei DSM 12395]|uniref:Site-specific DNA recombinase n=1 Tax=Desulforamulus putei DSM 12395 TaxID=1121429 RepID=A0A1M4UTQ7_9FIRM|nr:recombinase family protein [Desulforamulus putei]SHE60102.1 site-specific DNA recombinase [Desulforamulus putei DSM 12395]